MKNYLYSDKIAERIQALLDRELTAGCAKNVSIGDLSILPEPEELTDYLPAVLIHNTEVQVEDVNAGLDIVLTENHFEIMYLYPYTFAKMEDVPAEAKKHVNTIANLLMNHRTLEEYTVEPTEKEAGGQLLSSRVEAVRFDCAETKLFRAIDIPMSMGIIDYTAEFRTYQKGARIATERRVSR